MRVGENPAKFGGPPPAAAPVTVALATYIPVETGYFAQSLDVLRLSLTSLLANTPRPFDLMVFDNGSCPAVVGYLSDLKEKGQIQYLVLSEENVGKTGAWNFIIGAAPGEYLAYADSDVYFHPGWLEAELRVASAFPNAGMVSGFPAMHAFGYYTDSTLELAEADPAIAVERGQFTPDEWIVDWGQSLGQDPVAFLATCRQLEQVLLTRDGVSAFAVATHFQFLAPLAALRSIWPLSGQKLVGAESVLDERLDRAGFARLAVDRPVVNHLGNELSPEWREAAATLGLGAGGRRERSTRGTGRLLRWGPVRRVVIELYRFASKLMMRSLDQA